MPNLIEIWFFDTTNVWWSFVQFMILGYAFIFIAFGIVFLITFLFFFVQGKREGTLLDRKKRQFQREADQMWSDLPNKENDDELD